MYTKEDMDEEIKLFERKHGKRLKYIFKEKKYYKKDK